MALEGRIFNNCLKIKTKVKANIFPFKGVSCFFLYKILVGNGNWVTPTEDQEKIEYNSIFILPIEYSHFSADIFRNFCIERKSDDRKLVEIFGQRQHLCLNSVFFTLNFVFSILDPRKPIWERG